MFGVEEVANGRHGDANPFGLRRIGLERLALVAAQRILEGGLVEHPDPSQAMPHAFATVDACLSSYFTSVTTDRMTKNTGSRPPDECRR
jgi:hypothetical protein